MPQFVLQKLSEALNAVRKPLHGSRILLVGLAYKANVDDDRESPAYVLMNLLEHSGSEVSYYDPFVPVIRPTREHSQWAGTESVKWNQETLESFDAAIVVTAHSNVDYQQLVDWSTIVLDTRNATKSMRGKAKIVKA